MAEKIFTVSISPVEAQLIVENEISAELVYSEKYDLGNGKVLAISVFEKYFFRSSNRAALTVIFENLSGDTQVKAISTGSSQGLLLNIDYGAADSFANSVEKILKGH